MCHIQIVWPMLLLDYYLLCTLGREKLAKLAWEGMGKSDSTSCSLRGLCHL